MAPTPYAALCDLEGLPVSSNQAWQSHRVKSASYFALGFLATTLGYWMAAHETNATYHAAVTTAAEAATSTTHAYGLSRRHALLGASSLAAGLMGVPQHAQARKEGLNQPEMLPSGPAMNLVDKVQLLTKSQLKEVNGIIDDIARFGVKLRVMIQKYPGAPGEAIVDYWDPDDDTVILVVDDTFPNLLHFNVGANVKIGPPNGRFWSKLESDYGVLKYVRQNGEDQALLNALYTIRDGLAKERV